jgi:glycosyltransferase involved in cell wall biosynthesis
MPSLTNDIKKLLKDFGEREVVVGIPSYNNEGTISYVVRQAYEGLMKYFEGNGCILNCDGGSTDATQSMFSETVTETVPKATFQYEGVAGKGSALKAMIEGAYLLGAKVLVFVDSDLRSIRPEWISLLANPILEGKSCYVTPFYHRHKYDGTITNQICYPLTSVLYGNEVRQPIGGDFGVSRRMMEVYLHQDNEIWQGDVARFGIDIWMTTLAINEGELPISQAALGVKIHDVKDPGKHLGPMFSQVVGTLFELMNRYKNRWMCLSQFPKAAKVYGKIPDTEIEPLAVDLDNLKQKAQREAENWYPFFEKMLSVDYLQMQKQILQTGTLGPEEWIRYVFMVSKKAQIPEVKRTWIESMIPFYYARVADFVERTRTYSDDEAEAEIKKQLLLVWELKKELVSIWSE